MNEANEQHLIATYPKLFKNCGYCGCGDGWFDIINNLSSEIVKHSEYQPDHTFISQVKEKFGGLRFYHAFERKPPPLGVGMKRFSI